MSSPYVGGQTGFRPCPLLPTGNQFVAAEKAHWRLDGEIDFAKGELDIELSNSYLSRELTDDRGQVEVFWDSIHLSQ